MKCSNLSILILKIYFKKMSYILEYLYLTDKKFSIYFQHNENHQLLKMQNVAVLSFIMHLKYQISCW